MREQGSPNAGTAGYYWYWVVAVIAVIVLFWGVPRLMHMLKGSPPGRKPCARRFLGIGTGLDQVRAL